MRRTLQLFCLAHLCDAVQQCDVPPDEFVRAGNERLIVAHQLGTKSISMHQHTNRLINETSPYLLQHAHNPVDWYPWGDEALQKAKAEDKPILVSIGYAACHWCHVMEKESFEDASTAAIMNEHFINIKIDREERPDLDHVYMDAVQAMAGSGGWPLNVFLMPDGKPFYGGTYFPPQRAFNRPSWKEILTSVHEAYQQRKHELESQAENLTAHLGSANAFGLSASSEQFNEPDLKVIAVNMLKQADQQHGGFGAAPKFPQTFTIQYLLRHFHYTGEEDALHQALLSLDKMIYGGIYDQLGGGFARYSTDAEWLAPHFEKMLYDNALLVMVMSEAYQLTQKALYRETIEHTIRFIRREMYDGEGGFYSALDADSEGVEGKFYTWSKHEIDNLLGEEAVLFNEFYDVSEGGNWEHTNILRVQQPVEQFASQRNLEPADVAARLAKGRTALMQHRSKRTRPMLDDKILLGWNALMNTALSKAYAATLDQGYLDLALANIRFLEQKLNKGDGWFHTYKAGKARISAFLDDLAYLAQAYIHLQEVTGELTFLLKARSLTEQVVAAYSDEVQAMFYYTPEGQADIIVRKKEVYDGATPSGNAVMAMVLKYLATAFDIPDWAERSASMTGSLRSVVTRYPTSFGLWAQHAQALVHGSDEIAIVGGHAPEFREKLLPVFLPNKVLQTAINDVENFPLLRNRMQQTTMIYRCINYVCDRPFESVDALLEAIQKRSGIRVSAF